MQPPVFETVTLMWSRIRGQVLRVFVQKGLNEGSQAIYCLEPAQ
jgi:hypothetical protein